MVCEYIDKCRKCGGAKKWLCKAQIPKKKITDRAFCLDPVKSECAVYRRAKAGDKK